MKSCLIVITALCAAVASAELDARCAWGQSYWCSTLDAAKSCGAVEHCKITVWKNQVLKQDASDSCSFCKLIIDDVKKFVEQGKTKEEISHFLSSACGVIPQQSMAEKCKQVVEVAITEILDLVITGVEPQMICSMLSLCSGLEDSVQHAAIQSLPSQPVTSGESKQTDVVNVNAEPICSDCKKFFKDVKDMITSNKTQSDLEQVIDQAVCINLGRLRDECKALVHEFLPELLHLLSSYYDPNLICNSLGVCNADKVYYAKNFQLFARLRMLPKVNPATRQSSGTTCVLCKAILVELQTLGRDKRIQESLKSFVKNNFCSHAGSYKDACEKTVDDYSLQLFELLVTLLEPSTRCRSLGFCDASLAAGNAEMLVKTMPMLPLTPAKYPTGSAAASLKITAGPQCMLCELVMKEVVGLIGENATEQSVVHALEKVCRLMPSKLVESCVDFVDMYGPAVIELLLHELDPKIICRALHLCDSSNLAAAVTAVNVAAPMKPKADSNNEMCAVCEMMIEYIESMLKQNSSVAEIQALLDRICYHLPQKYIDKCQNLVKEYTDILIQYLSELASPKEICMLIGVCDKSLEKQLIGGAEERKIVPVTGQNECTWGSGYWCLNRETAEKCNAVDYCKRFVWKKEQ